MNITDLFAETRKLVDATSTSYVDADVLRRMNAGYEEIVGLLINADGTWQFDDTNYTTNPIGTITLQEGISSYTFLDTFLDVENVKIQDLNGHWHLLQPLDQSQANFALEEFLTANGFPEYYDKSANTLRLYRAPTATVVTLTNGLKVQFKRTASVFTTSDIATGTITPGFASPWHILLAYKAALPYAASYKKDRMAWLNGEIQRLTAELIDHYGQREKDKRKVITTKRVYNR